MLTTFVGFQTQKKIFFSGVMRRNSKLWIITDKSRSGFQAVRVWQMVLVLGNY